METLKFKIIDPIGIHAKNASSLVNIASQYDATIMLHYGDNIANMKSILSLIALGINSNKDITITIEGHDEYLVAKEIFNYLINQKIGIII